MMNTQIETSPLTQELYAIDWSARFDEFRKTENQNYGALNSLLAKVERFVERELKNRKEDLNDINVLKTKFNRAKPDSNQWHCLSILINVKIIHEAIPKGLTSTATLSAIQIMEHMWKVIASKQELQLTPSTATKMAKKPVTKTAAKPSSEKAQSKTEEIKQTLANYSSRARNKANKSAKTDNVVINKLAADASTNDTESLAKECYEVACALAEEYPEYTLTAIRVMTAEKMGVTRQFIENLDIRPDRFKNAS